MAEDVNTISVTMAEDANTIKFTGTSPDPYIIIGSAIRNRMKLGKDKKINVDDVAKLIADNFLDDIIEHQSQVVEESNKRLNKNWSDAHRYEKQAREAEQKLKRLNEKYNRLKDQYDALRALRDEIANETVGGEVETDPYLSGAKKAFSFILHETGNKDLAAKAFNSYLLLGKKQEGDSYVAPKTTLLDEYNRLNPDSARLTAYEKFFEERM